jgi:hypothetical protein
MKNIGVIIFVCLFTGGISCNKSNSDPAPAPNPNVTFLANLNGTHMIPLNSTTATGTGTLIFNTTTKIYTLTITHNVVSPTNGHFMQGTQLSNGIALFTFASFTSPITYTSSPLSASEEANLYNNLYYVDIHSATYPAGEIRGQLIKQ